MDHRRPGRVFHLEFLVPFQLDFLSGPREQLLSSIAPGHRVTRYGRTWIIGQTEMTNDVLSGRIGFQGSGTTEIFDEATNDFIDISIPAGTTAPFAIHLETFQAVMQAGSGQIKIRGLIGAFEALLSEAGFKWKIVGSNREVSLAQWKHSVEKVTSIKFTIKKPNPHYAGRVNLKALMEDFEAETTRLEIINESEGVNLESEFIVETEEHIEAGYGDAEYRGVKREGSEIRESVYVSSYGVEEDSEEVAVDPASGEVPTHSLRRMITDSQEEGENGTRDHLTDPFSDN